MVLRSSSNTDEEEATTAALCYALIASHAHAENGKLTLAIIGDWPYSLDLVAAAPLLIESINSDPHVSLVLHVGDIHSGSMPCTGAGLLPLPAGSNPAWNLAIFTLFGQFKDPVVRRASERAGERP